MIKNEKGITLISLIVTIIVMLILVGVGLTITYSEVDDARNNKLWGELGIVRQAVVEQYQKALAVGKTGESKDNSQLEIWVGELIDANPNKEIKFDGAINAELERQEITDAYMFTYDFNAEKCLYQEDCYYRLKPADLEKLGIEDATHTYIVNYKTGEVYNETKQIDFNGKLLYLIPVNYDNKVNITDSESFNDWSNGLDG